MKSAKLMCITAIASFAALGIPVRLAAQANQEHNHKHHHYQLIDLGTFGGPASYINNQFSIGAPNQINSRGTTVGAAATSIPSPGNSNTSICEGLDGILPFVFHAFKWQDGTVTDLGTLPGADNCSVATSINANGEIAGYGENGVVDPLIGIREVRAVVWENGEIIDLGTFGGNQSVLGNINNRGQVAGAATNTIPDPFSLYYQLGGLTTGTQTRAFLWQNGQKQDLGTLGGPDAAGAFVNERGQVVGFSYTNSTPNATTGLPTLDPFLWEKGTMIDLGTLGGTYGLATKLNNRGDVVGTSNLAGDQASHPFLWRHGKLVDLFTTTIGGSPITANQLNDNGEIVGGAAFPNRPFDAYLWRNGVATDLGTLNGDCFSEAVALNSRSQVVGYSQACDFSAQGSFLWENGSMVDLNTLIPPNSGLSLVETIAINDQGEIAGDGDPGCGSDALCGHAYLLIPCDENHPGVEGCDYSLVEATALPQIPARPDAPSRTSGHAFQLPRTRSPFGNRILGRTPVKNGIDSEGQAGQLRNTGDLLPDPLDGLGLLCFFRCCRGCSGTGYCTLDSNNKLTGTCFGQILGSSQCASKFQPVQCPVGKQAIRPANFSCSIGSLARVDAARSCTD